MKKTISLICVALSTILFLLTINATDLVLRFIVVGQIPGTEVLIPPLGMIVMWIGLISAGILSRVNISKLITPQVRE